MPEKEPVMVRRYQWRLHLSFDLNDRFFVATDFIEAVRIARRIVNLEADSKRLSSDNAIVCLERGPTIFVEVG